MDAMQAEVRQIEDKIKAIHEGIYSREYKLKRLQEE